MNNRPCTSGYTLVEMLVVIAMASTLFAVAIGMIHRTMTLESTGRERAAAHRTAMRLATQFRQDIHQASDTTLLQTDDDEQGNLLVAIPGPNRRHQGDVHHDRSWRTARAGVIGRAGESRGIHLSRRLPGQPEPTGRAASGRADCTPRNGNTRNMPRASTCIPKR